MHITMNIPWPAVVIAHLREGNTKQKGLDPHIDHHQDRIEMKSLRNAAWSMSPPETKAYSSAKLRSYAGSQNFGLKLISSWLVSE